MLPPNRPSTRAYIRAVAGKVFGLQSTTAGSAPPSAASTSVAVASSDVASPKGPLSAVAGNGELLLDGTARWRAGLSWYRPARVQLLAAPGHDGESNASPWSALVVDGVTVPYDQVAGVRMDESALEFVLEQTPRTTAALDAPPRQHLRMYTRFEFNLWREALSPIIANTTLHAQSCACISAGSKPSAVHAAQKWLAHAEEGGVRL